MLCLAHLTLSPRSTYSYPPTFPEAEDNSSGASPPPPLLFTPLVQLLSHEEEQLLEQLEQVSFVELPLHEDEQSEHRVLVALPRQLPTHPPSQLSRHAASQPSHPHEVNVVSEIVGPNTTAPKMGKVFVLILLKNSRLDWSPSFFLFLSMLYGT